MTEALEIVPLDGRLGSAAMDGSSQVAGVTPHGVREGDPAVLQALIERRGPAVYAFCTRVCGPAAATRASAEAFARFRAAVRDAIDLNTVEPEALLRGATRHAAASMARTPSGPPPHGRLRSRGTQTCGHVPTMLAARANGALGDADLERLARHLDRCERCNALAEIFRSAEAAYAEPAIETLGSDTTSALLAAMQAVPEHPLGPAPAPLPGAGAAEPQDGAFGHLPELDDEVPVAEGEGEGDADAEVEPEAEAESEAKPADDSVLAVEHVEAPAADLDADDLTAEPLPEQPPAETEDDIDLGETMEWDVVPIGPQRRTYAEAGAFAPVLQGGDEPRRRRLPSAPLLKIALPAALVLGFAIAALAATGVFGSDTPAPALQRSVAPRVQKPVLTPLPVTVVSQSTTTETTASTATPAPTAETSSAAPAETAATSTTAPAPTQ